MVLGSCIYKTCGRSHRVEKRDRKMIANPVAARISRKRFERNPPSGHAKKVQNSHKS